MIDRQQFFSGLKTQGPTENQTIEEVKVAQLPQEPLGTGGRRHARC